MLQFRIIKVKFMKKILLLSFLITNFFIASQGIAQEDTDLKTLYTQDVKTFTYGPRIGFSSSLLLLDPDNVVGKNELNFGFTAGGFLRYQLSKKFALQLDVVYTQRGGKYDSDDEIQFDFIDPELKLVFDAMTKFGKRRVLWNLFAGFQPSILISAKANDVDILENLNTTGFDAVVGGAFYIGRFVLSSNIKFGLSDLNDNLTFLDDTNNTVTPSFRSIASETTLSYRFGGKKK